MILAGDARWLDARAPRSAAQLRARRRAPAVGRHRLAAQQRHASRPRGRAIAPTLPTARDLFGARLGPVVRPPAPVTLVNVADRIDLFAGTAGQFGGIGAYEPTLDVRGGASAVARLRRDAGRRPPGDRRRAPRQGDRHPHRACRSSRRRVRESAELAELLDRTWTLLRTR